ncbi:MAG: hypothetical protein ABWJ99_00860 [Caldimicrobium sp.]
MAILFLPGPVFPAPLYEENPLISQFNPLKWFSSLFPKKENPLRLKLNVPPPPPPSILFQNNQGINQKVEKQTQSLVGSEKEKPNFLELESPKTQSQPQKTQVNPSPWRWY